MTDAIASKLAGHELLSGLKREYVEFLAAQARERSLPKGERLFQHGTAATTFYLVESGSVTLEVPAISGPKLEVQCLPVGSIIGWSWAIAPYKWTFDARASEDSTVLEFDGQAVLAKCDVDHEFGYELLKRFSSLMAERLEAARQRMMDEWNPPGFA